MPWKLQKIPKTRKIIHYPNWQFCFRSQWMRIPTQANKLKSWEARPTFSPSLRLVKQLLSLHWRISYGLSGKWTAPWRLGSVWIPKKNCQLYNCISQLPESSGNRVEGLCGNFNGVESDDRTGRAGEVTIFQTTNSHQALRSTNELVRAWEEPGFPSCNKDSCTAGDKTEAWRLCNTIKWDQKIKQNNPIDFVVQVSTFLSMLFCGGQICLAGNLPRYDLWLH